MVVIRYAIIRPVSFRVKLEFGWQTLTFMLIGFTQLSEKLEFARAIVGRGHDPADPVPVFDLVR